MIHLRIKNWSKYQHYSDRMPPWIKFYGALMDDDDFLAFDELAQWQLVRMWLVASRSTKFTHDEDGRPVPVILRDAAALQRAIKSLRRVPVAKFERAGFLIPVDESSVVSITKRTEIADQVASALLASTASTIASTLLDLEIYKTPEVPSEKVFPPLALASSQPLPPGTAPDNSPLGKLRRACQVAEGSTDERKLERAMRGVSEVDLVDVAFRCPPDVRSRLGWTLSELKKRRTRGAA